MIKISGPRAFGAAFGTAVLLTASLLNATPAWAGPFVSLPGSTFEIDEDANLKLDGDNPALTQDWATVTEIRKTDQPTGGTDDSFGQGAKENTPVPTVVDGSIPNNKSDLKTFGVYQEGTTTTGFLNLFWTRVQEPSGTTNMDFEFNQSATTSGNGVTPVRTTGDLLITYDLSKGGTHPTLSLRTWTGTAWSGPTDLTGSAMATGSINTSAIPAADGDGLAEPGTTQLDPRTFGEAQIALAAIFPNPNVCETFGSAYLKSRSSDAFTAELKDFIAPVPVNISNCGAVKIIKTDDLGTPLAGATFVLYKDNPPIGGSRGPEDTLQASLTCTTTLPTGSCTINNVLVGDYWVVETVTPPGHDPVADTPVHVNAQQTVTVGPLTDPRQRGAIKVTKTRKHAADGTGDHAQSGVTFQIDGGATAVTDANGVACFDNLLFGNHTIHEVTPANYTGEADKIVNVDNAATCAAAIYVGETVSFHNTPLSTITVSFTSQVAGGTLAKISCTGLTATPPDGTPNAFDDTSETFVDLVPGTYTCTVVIDP